MRLRPASLGGALSGLVFAFAVLAGCGGSRQANSIASRMPGEIVAATRLAAAGASSVHISGAIAGAGPSITLDLNLLAGKGGRGRLSENGLDFEVIQTGGAIYVKGSPALYEHIGGAAAAHHLRGRWLKAPVTRGSFATLASLMDLRQLLGTTLAGHGALVKGPMSIVNGQRVVPVTDTSTGGTLRIATSGPPYPVEVSRAGAGGRIVFDHWNEPVALAAPEHAVDLTRSRFLP